MAKAVFSPILPLLCRVIDDQRGRHLSDQDLLRRFQDQRDEPAFHLLLRRHGPMVLDVCRGVLRNEADAEDAFQATFLILARKAASIRKTASLGSWLHGVAYRTALKARVQSATRQKHEARAPARPIAEPDDLTWQEVRQVLHEELTGLAERYRAPLVVCYLEGKTQDKAAAQLGLAKSTLKERLERGRSLLRARLVRRGLGPTAVLVATAWPSATATACPPATLVSSTVKAASLFAAGQAAASGVISIQVAALTEGVLQTMLLSKIKTATAVVLLLLSGVGGALALLPRVAAQNEAAKQAEAKAGQQEAKATAGPLKAKFPDLTKIDRTLVKEPKYKNQPFYALLAIGPEAKNRVWLVVDGDVLYVDRNGNGDLTEEGERVERDPKLIEVAPGDIKWMASFYLGEVQGVRVRVDYWVRDKEFVTYTLFDKRVRRDHEEFGWENSTLWRVTPDGKNGSAQTPLTFCRRPKDAQVCHLGGTVTPFLYEESLYRDADHHWLAVYLGTPGLAPANSYDPVYTRVGTSEVPADAHPVAHFEFPHKEAGKPPIPLKVVLDQRCCGDRFYGPVRVPADAAKGKAKVTVSFPAWKEGKVAPATFEVGFAEKAPEVRKPEPRPEPVRKGQVSPDWLPLGTVCTGTIVEASFAVYGEVDDAKKTRVRVEAPPFVQVVDRSVIEREFYEGDKRVKGVAGIVVIRIDTSKPGVLQGQIEVELESISARRGHVPVTAKMPVSVVVKRPGPGAVKMLVVESPFHWTSTGDPGVFKEWTDLAAEAGWNVSYLTVAEGKPVFRDLDLSKFDVVLLAPAGLNEGTAEEVKRVRAFVEGGGRLVVAASAFYWGSVEAANKVLDGYGLKMLYQEATFGKNRVIPAEVLDKEAFAAEVIKAGIKSVRFYRASPIVVSADKPARVLVKAAGVGGPKDGFVAAAKAGKGEVVALGQSLWWNWVSENQARGTDNAQLLRLLLTPAAEKFRKKD